MKQNNSLFKNDVATHVTLPNETMTLNELDAAADNHFFVAVQSLTQRADHLENTIELLANHSDLLESTLADGGQGLNEQGAVLSRVYVEKLMDDLDVPSQEMGDNMFGATQSYTDAGTRAANTAAAVQAADNFVTKAWTAFITWMKDRIDAIKGLFSGKGGNSKTPDQIQAIVNKTVDNNSDLIEKLDGKSSVVDIESDALAKAFHMATDSKGISSIAASNGGAEESLKNAVEASKSAVKIVESLSDGMEKLNDLSNTILSGLDDGKVSKEDIEKSVEAAQDVITKALSSSAGEAVSDTVLKAARTGGKTTRRGDDSAYVVAKSGTFHKPMAGVSSSVIVVEVNKEAGKLKVSTVSLKPNKAYSGNGSVKTLTVEQMKSLNDQIQAVGDTSKELGNSVKAFNDFDKAASDIIKDIETAKDKLGKKDKKDVVSLTKAIDALRGTSGQMTTVVSDVMNIQRSAITSTSRVVSMYIKESAKTYK